VGNRHCNRQRVLQGCFVEPAGTDNTVSWLASWACVGVRQELDKEMTMIAALKQHYEYYHAGDVTALKKLYEYHAENCVKAAELTEDTQRREEYLKLARQWTEAAVPL